MSTTTDRKKKNQFINNVQLHPIHIDHNDFAMKYFPTKKYFNPSDLDSKNVETRLEAREKFQKFYVKMLLRFQAQTLYEIVEC